MTREPASAFEQEDPESHPRTIKVKVTMSVEIDVDSYRLNYGAESVAEIRSDVARAILSAVQSGGVLADSIVGAKLYGDR